MISVALPSALCVAPLCDEQAPDGAQPTPTPRPRTTTRWKSISAFWRSKSGKQQTHQQALAEAVLKAGQVSYLSPSWRCPSCGASEDGPLRLIMEHRVACCGLPDHDPSSCDDTTDDEVWSFGSRCSTPDTAPEPAPGASVVVHSMRNKAKLPEFLCSVSGGPFVGASQGSPGDDDVYAYAYDRSCLEVDSAEDEIPVLRRTQCLDAPTIMTMMMMAGAMDSDDEPTIEEDEPQVVHD